MANRTLTFSSEGRGSGKTFRQVQELPDGSLLIIKNHQIREHIKGILKAQKRSSKALTLLVISNHKEANQLAGMRGRDYAFDHDVLANMPKATVNLIKAFLENH